MKFEDIVWEKTYEVTEDFGDRRIRIGTHVVVKEILPFQKPFVYVYGCQGGSAYIRADCLKEISRVGAE